MLRRPTRGCSDVALIPKPQFPNVPQLPGVPQLRRSLLPNFAPGPPAILTGIIAVGRLVLALTAKPTWGIYKISPPKIEPATDEVDGDGNPLLDTVVVEPPAVPVIEPDSYRRMQNESNSDVTTAPIQDGSFASYNKVANPFELRLRLFKAGTLKQRQDFLDTLDQIANSADLYRVVTPERIYASMSIEGYRLVREGNTGAYALAEVEISFVEIRQVQPQYTSTAEGTQNAKAASAQPVSNAGSVNAVPPPNSIRTKVDAVLAPLRRLSSVLGN